MESVQVGELTLPCGPTPGPMQGPTAGRRLEDRSFVQGLAQCISSSDCWFYPLISFAISE